MCLIISYRFSGPLWKSFSLFASDRFISFIIIVLCLCQMLVTFDVQGLWSSITALLPCALFILFNLPSPCFFLIVFIYKRFFASLIFSFNSFNFNTINFCLSTAAKTCNWSDVTVILSYWLKQVKQECVHRGMDCGQNVLVFTYCMHTFSSCSHLTMCSPYLPQRMILLIFPIVCIRRGKAQTDFKL